MLSMILKWWCLFFRHRNDFAEGRRKPRGPVTSGVLYSAPLTPNPCLIWQNYPRIVKRAASSNWEMGKAPNAPGWGVGMTFHSKQFRLYFRSFTPHFQGEGSPKMFSLIAVPERSITVASDSFKLSQNPDYQSALVSSLPTWGDLSPTLSLMSLSNMTSGSLTLG